VARTASSPTAQAVRTSPRPDPLGGDPADEVATASSNLFWKIGSVDDIVAVGGSFLIVGDAGRP
jgi:hypothetical protein